MARLSIAFLLALLGAGAAAAQQPDEPPRKLILRPAAAPARALKYRLLPELAEQTHGDAVPHYQRASKLWKQLTPAPGEEHGRWAERAEAWLKVPPPELPRDEVREYLKPLGELFEAVEAGARCEYCNDDLAARIRKEGIGTLMPEVQDARGFVRLLALRARLELADGKVADAVRTLRHGFALARHVGQGPTLINGLVGVAIATVLADQLEAVLRHPEAPNLYFALTDLPRPFLDFRKPLQGERLFAYGNFPGLIESADPKAPRPAPAQIKRWAETVVRSGEFGRFGSQIILAAQLLAKHETSKRALLDDGWPHDKVEAMPHLQVALLHSFLEYDRHYDDIAKYASLPHWEAYPWFQEADKKLRDSRADADRRRDAPLLPIAQLLLPATQKVLIARVRLDRRIAVLRCVEAVRLYAAAHGGKLPASLADVKEVPVPVDPVTGKPFGYKLADGKATLTSPPIPGTGDHRTALAYELELKR